MDIRVGSIITGITFDEEQKVVAIQWPNYQLKNGSWVNWEHIRSSRQPAWDMEAFGA